MEELPKGWTKAFHTSTGHWYYYNASKNLSQWTHPLSSADGATTSGAASHETNPQPASGGWFYRDMYGRIQGPFTLDHLRGWRGQLPMDMYVWYTESSDGAEQEMPAVELAELLGDGHMLANWRSACPGEQTEGSAPPAAVWEEWVNRESTPNAQASKEDYAATVLAALPPTDEAVQLAHLAAAAGKTLQDLVDFNYASHARPTLPEPAEDAVPLPSSLAPAHLEYENPTAVRNPYSGRISAVGEEPTGAANLYREMQGWCDPVELEKALQEISRRKQMKLPPHVWKKLKERKLQVKKKIQRQLCQ